MSSNRVGGASEWDGFGDVEGAAIAPANTSNQVFISCWDSRCMGDADAATASVPEIVYRVGSRTYIYTTANKIELVRRACP